MWKVKKPTKYLMQKQHKKIEYLMKKLEQFVLLRGR